MYRIKQGVVLLMMVALGSAALADGFFPFYDNIKTEQGSFFAVRPLYSHTVVEEGEIRDYLWPIYSRKEFKEEQSSRALFVWWTHQFNAQEESPRHRNWLLPVYFQGRDANNKGYFALFPLGGTIKEFLGRDEISFVLFPMVGKSRINDVKTTSILWPVVSHTRGTGIARDRVFPIYGKSVLEGKYEKHFALWPFWTSAEYFYPGNSGKAWILFPVCGRSKMEQESTWWLIPPFFRFTDGVKQDKLYCPWPFVQRTKSEAESKLYFWPLWGKKERDGGFAQRTFAFWPLLWSEQIQDQHLLTTRKRAVPFVSLEHCYAHEKGASPEDRTEVSSYWRVWPLMSWQNEADISRFRMLELWPVKDSPPFERNWTPLWTLYKRTNNEGIVRKDILWFIWHSERDSAVERKEWSLLKGLTAYKNQCGKRSLRLLYVIRLGEKE